MWIKPSQIVVAYILFVQKRSCDHVEPHTSSSQIFDRWIIYCCLDSFSKTIPQSVQSEKSRVSKGSVECFLPKTKISQRYSLDFARGGWRAGRNLRRCLFFVFFVSRYRCLLDCGWIAISMFASQIRKRPCISAYFFESQPILWTLGT